MNKKLIVSVLLGAVGLTSVFGFSKVFGGWFGETTIDTPLTSFRYGSGGDVRYPYKTTLMDSLIEANVQINEALYARYDGWVKEHPALKPNDGRWGRWPVSFQEMHLTDEVVKTAAEESEVALVVIGRAAGEDRENILKAGGFYLTKLELEMIRRVTKYFNKVAVIMDCGNLIDMGWTLEFGDSITAIVYGWQGGMEGGHGICDILTGAVNPSGRLTDTVAVRYEDYPSAMTFGNKRANNYEEDIYVGYRYFETFCKDRALYPFGHGLSYTTFKRQVSYRTVDETMAVMSVTVTNTGDCSGATSVLAYFSAPFRALDKPAIQLGDYKKTKVLAPGESETLELSINIKDFASFDDSGVTGHINAFVLEEGKYYFYVGGSVRDVEEVGCLYVNSTLVVKQCRDALGIEPGHEFKRLTNKYGKKAYTRTPSSTVDLKSRILSELPEPIKKLTDEKVTFDQVLNGQAMLHDFVASLTPSQLDDLTRGYGPMNYPDGLEGNAGAFGGVTDELKALGVPAIITTDGPSGVRCGKTAALLPCGTAIASTFDIELVEELYSLVGKEMVALGSDVLLGPGMNIHRNPLCGRNFEYYSEDPIVTAYTAAAFIRGIRSQKVTCCPKHFACNNQETRRYFNDSRVSARALREIYLKAFEYLVINETPDVIMTSYNKINGVWSHYNYELATTILRNEWEYDGLLITDWWMQKAVSKEFPLLENDAYRVRAQVDVLMPGNDGFMPSSKTGRKLLDSYGREEGITIGEMQRCALNVLKFIIRTGKKNG